MDGLYKVKFIDEGGETYGILTNETEQDLLIDITFELNDTGCGAFSIRLSDIPSFSIKRNDIVEIYAMGDTLPWYTGFIQSIPEEGRTDNIYEYSGYGLIAQLDDITLNESYSVKDVAAIISDILFDYVVINTSIIINDNKIDTAPYIVNSVDYSLTKVKKAIFDLVQQADGWVAGVDETREFYFKQKTTDIQLAAVKAIEYHIDQFYPKEDVTNIKNRIYVKGGKITNGSNYVLTVEDEDSQDEYGLKEDVMTFPSSDNNTDIKTWADKVLAGLKDPVITAEIKDIDITFLGEKITAEGKARILLRAEE